MAETESNKKAILQAIEDAHAATEIDKKTALQAIEDARAVQCATIEISPQSYDPRPIIDLCLKEIRPEERIRIIIPRIYSHDPYGNYQDLSVDAVDSLELDYIDRPLNDKVFLMFRNRIENDGNTTVLADIYHF